MRARRQGDLIALEVTDTGPGPPEELGESIAEPFVTTKAVGVGLGLMLARQAAESEGGTLTWKRTDGLTLFCMSWPAP